MNEVKAWELSEIEMSWVNKHSNQMPSNCLSQGKIENFTF